MINSLYFRTFVALSETKSFIATAKKLHMTQPGVSQHLKHLEEYYGVILIERKGKFFQLTEAGRKLNQHCHQFFVDHERFKATITEDHPTKGICHIASPGSFGLMLYTFLLDLNKKHTDLVIHFTVSPNTGVVQGLLEDRYHLGFVSVNISEPMLETSKISQEKLLLVAPKKAKITNFADIKKLGFIAHPDGYHYASRLLQENFPKEFSSIDAIPLKGFINQANRILDPVVAGLGFSVLPEYAVKASAQQKSVQVIAFKRPVVDPIHVVVKRSVRLPERYRFLIEKIKIHIRSLL
jgi:DNA-binding transcriptional LysR family regulator